MFATALGMFAILAALGAALLICFVWAVGWNHDRALLGVLAALLLGLSVLMVWKWSRTRYMAGTGWTLLYHLVTEATLDRHQFHALCRDFFQCRVYGDWPSRQPVLFLVNYPREPLEYFYFGLVPMHCAPVAMLSGWPLRAARDRKHPWVDRIKFRFLNTVFTEGENYLERRGKHGFEGIKKGVAEQMSKGHSVWAYPERNDRGAERVPGTINVLHTGLFRIAAQLQIPIVPLICSYLKNNRGEKPVVHCVVGPEISPAAVDGAELGCRQWMQSVLDWSTGEK